MPPRETQEVHNTPPAGTNGPDAAHISKDDSDALRAARAGQAAALPTLSIDAINFAQANLDRMDGNGNGFVSADELAGFAKANRGKLTADEQELITELKSNMGKLQNAHDDKGLDSKGFTRWDLMDSKQGATESAQPRSYDSSGGDLRPALDYANKNFDKMDLDHDGHLTFNEINTYVTDHQLSASESRMLRNLSEHSLEVAGQDNYNDRQDRLNGITKKDIARANDNINALIFAVENFNDLDAHEDGFITADEISGYERARNDLTGTEVKALEYLKANIHTYEKMSNDEFGTDDNGITGYDLMASLDVLGSANARGQAKLGEKPAETVMASTQPAAETEPETCDPEAQECETEQTAETTKPKEEEKVYEVKPNDSLWKICREDLRERNGGQEPSYKDILHEIDTVAAANGIERDAIIHPGQKLKLHVRPVQEQPARPVEPAHIAPGEPAPARTRREPPVEGPRREPPVETSRERREERTEEQRAPRLPQRELSSTDVLRKHFDRIDVDGNNRVSEREIRQYLYDFGPDISPKDQIALNRIARQAGKIQELANDERGDENSGISDKDLQKVDEMQEAARIMQKSGMWSNFNTDGDKYLKKGEIETALRRANISPEERKALNYMYDNYGKFQEGNNDEKGDENSGITWNDLRWYANFV